MLHVLILLVVTLACADAFTTPTKPSGVSSTAAAPAGLTTTQRETQFEAWAAAAQIAAPKLTHGVFRASNGADLRGLQASETIASGETLVRLPKAASLTLRPGETASPFRSWVPDQVWLKQQWYAKLALKLLWERGLGTSRYILSC
jgi:hypothetical protein